MQPRADAPIFGLHKFVCFAISLKYVILNIYYNFRYPFVQKVLIYPKGHCVVYIGEEGPPIEKVLGLIYCEAIPPKNLYFPVLGEYSEQDKKLVFHLCSKCSALKNEGKCTHTDEERKMIGVWCSNEILLAIKFGYRIKRLETWHYPESMKNSSDNEGMWTAYINEFLKLKQQSSDWPANVNTPEEKDLYIKNYLEHEQIALNPDEICKNEVLRTIAKLSLNTLWYVELILMTFFTLSLS